MCLMSWCVLSGDGWAELMRQCCLIGDGKASSTRGLSFCMMEIGEHELRGLKLTKAERAILAGHEPSEIG